MATFVTLVHGTWARRAKWIQPDSALARYLSDSVAGPVHVTTPPFTWSGSNRLSARLKAAENLRRRLSEQVRDHPNDAHYVIGHSHGGSVAAYAIQDCEDLRVRVRLICLSTPFLQLELNTLTGSTRRKLSTLQLFLFSLLLVAVTTVASRSPWIRASSLAACVVCSTVLWKTRAGALLRRKDRVTKLIAKASVNGLDPRHVLLIRSDSDEASLGLALAQSCTLGADFLSSSSARFLTPPSWVLNLIVFTLFLVLQPLALLAAYNPGDFQKLGQALNLWLAFKILDYQYASDNYHGVDWDALFGKLPGAIQLAILAPLIAVIIPLIMVLLPLAVAGVMTLVAGIDLLRYQPLLRSSVEASPPGGWQVHLFPGRSPAASGLHHSRSWQDPRVHRLIVAWIGSTDPDRFLIAESELAPEQLLGGAVVERSPRKWRRIGETTAAVVLAIWIVVTVAMYLLWTTD